MGAPACWTGYIWVADVDAAGEKNESDCVPAQPASASSAIAAGA